MAHAAKYTKSATGHLFKHYEREKNEKGEYINFGNESINTSKTHLNYNLAPERNQLEFLKQRCSEVQCLNRKDVNVMCSWVVTVPKDLPGEREREFFEQSYKFLENRYGKENVISAYVHMDEVTPHIHYSFVPVTKDKNKDKYKVSAKEVIDKKDLQMFHKDLDSHLTDYFGQSIGILNEATKEGNKSIVELKKETMREEFKKLSNRSSKLDKANKDINRLLDKLDKINPGKTMIGNKLTITQEEYSVLITLANEGGKKIKENLQLKVKVGALEEKLNKMSEEFEKEPLNKDISLKDEKVDIVAQMLSKDKEALKLYQEKKTRGDFEINTPKLNKDRGIDI